MGWSDVARGPFRVTVVDGGHLSMLAEPHVQGLADVMGADLAEMVALTEPDGTSSIKTTTESQAETEIVAALGRGVLPQKIAGLLREADRFGPEGSALIERVDRLLGAQATEALRLANVAQRALEAADLTARPDPVPERLTVPIARLAVSANNHQPRAQQPVHEETVALVTRTVAALADLGLAPQQRLSVDELAERVAAGHPAAAFVADDGLARLDVRWSIDDPSMSGLTDRSGVDAHEDLGVHLGTPADLIGPVLALADPQADELVVDLGCGDGRVLVEAVRQFGCRGRGVENDPALVAAARRRVDQAGLAGQIEIIEDDAGAAAVDDADVVFLFLPPRAVVRLLDELPSRLRAGARILAHEQLAIDWPTPPDTSRLIAETNLTVAHRWTVT